MLTYPAHPPQIEDQLAVAVSTLDRPDDLACCLEAIAGGDALPGELVIVDQSQEQSARPVAMRYQYLPIQVRYVPQERRGLSASRNAAIAASRSPMIAFTDDDCVPDRGWVKALIEAFNRQPQPGAVTGRLLPRGPEAPGLYSVSPREDPFSKTFVGKAIPWKIGTGGNCAVRRLWLDQAGGFNEWLGAGAPGKAAEDADLFYRLLRSGARIHFTPDAIMYHQRQSREKRLSSRWNYGYGIGALCALMLRRRDPFGLYALSDWVFNLSRELAGLAWKRQPMEVQQRALALRGTLQGFWAGLLSRQARK